MRIAALMVASLFAVMTIASCSDNSDDSGSSSELTGLVVEIESEGFNEVTSFVLRSEGENYTIYIDDTVDYGFPLEHLFAHRSGAEPVKVEFYERDGRRYATSIDDA